MSTGSDESDSESESLADIGEKMMGEDGLESLE